MSHLNDQEKRELEDVLEDARGCGCCSGNAESGELINLVEAIINRALRDES